MHVKTYLRQLNDTQCHKERMSQTLRESKEEAAGQRMSTKRMGLL